MLFFLVFGKFLFCFLNIFVVRAQVGDMNLRIKEQIADMNARIKEQVAEQLKIANQGARLSINTSIKEIVRQIDEKNKEIEAIDNRTYNKQTSLAYGEKKAYFNGQYFTREINGEKLNQEESDEAWNALKNIIQGTLKGLLRTKASLENTLSKFS